jgi:hypothetical membrane protein
MGAGIFPAGTRRHLNGAAWLFVIGALADDF